MPEQRGWTDRLLGAAFTLLLAAGAVYLAVRLLQAVLWWLAGIGVMVAFILVIVRLVRTRNQHW